LVLALLFVGRPVAAQSVSPNDDNAIGNSTPAASAGSLTDDSSVDSTPSYVPPTQEQRFHDFTLNAVGPIAFAGAAFSAAIDQGTDFPRQWGEAEGAYSERVASEFGINLVTVTAQYSLAEAFHEDTKYYRCMCSGFFPRLWHAAISTVAAHRGDDGNVSFSIALTASPFIGPMAAANVWIPSRNSPLLGFRMGGYNLLGQFGQNGALEFIYGGPRTLLGRIQRHFFKKNSNAADNS
jgi:hypothetical protein